MQNNHRIEILEMMKCSTENFLSSPEQSIFSSNYEKNAQKAFIGAVLSVFGYFCDFLKNHSPVFRKILILRNYVNFQIWQYFPFGIDKFIFLPLV